MLRESLQLERVESIFATSNVLHRVLTPAALTRGRRKGGLGVMKASGIEHQKKKKNRKNKGACLEIMSKENSRQSRSTGI